MINNNSIEAIKQKLINNKTIYESKIIDRLNSLKIFHEFQYYFGNGYQNYFVDFYFPQYKCYLELDGKNHKSTRKYDYKRKKFIESNFNITEIRLMNSISIKISNSDLKKLIQHTEKKALSKNMYNKLKKNKLKIKMINKKMHINKKIISLSESQLEAPTYKPRIIK